MYSTISFRYSELKMKILELTLICLLVYLAKGSAPNNFSSPCIHDAHYCLGEVLNKVQMSGIYNDSKTFVDMPLKQDWSKSLENDILQSKDNNQLKIKIAKYFYPAGTKELYFENISDWKPNPSILSKVEDKNYRNWTKHLCGHWKQLVRKVDEDVKTNNQRYSMIYLKERLVIPGDRFREIYYWDTYWSILGLLHCEMYDTTKKILENLIQMVNDIGFIPNGGRKYYENRSQPPFLTLMVFKYWNTTKDNNFVLQNHRTLMKEYNFWMENRLSKKTSKSNFPFNQYHSKLGFPRPESYKEDINMMERAGLSDDPLGQQKFYSQIASAAESGWDFSSRFVCVFTDFLSYSMLINFLHFYTLRGFRLVRFILLRKNTQKK